MNSLFNRILQPNTITSINGRTNSGKTLFALNFINDIISHDSITQWKTGTESLVRKYVIPVEGIDSKKAKEKLNEILASYKEEITFKESDHLEYIDKYPTDILYISSDGVDNQVTSFFKTSKIPSKIKILNVSVVNISSLLTHLINSQIDISKIGAIIFDDVTFVGDTDAELYNILRNLGPMIMILQNTNLKSGIKQSARFCDFVYLIERIAHELTFVEYIKSIFTKLKIYNFKLTCFKSRLPYTDSFHNLTLKYTYDQK